MNDNKLYKKGISDITSSEGNLKRFSRICKLLHSQKLITWAEIITLIKDKLIKNSKVELTNEKVIKRHIMIMINLGILESRDGGIIISSEGKVLFELLKNDNRNDELILTEKIFYLRALFINVFFQLYTLLKTIKKNEERSKYLIIIDYFSRIINSPFQLWRKETLRRGLDIFYTRQKIQRGLENKFECIRNWLRQLELLDRRNLILSKYGLSLLNDIEQRGHNLSERIYEIANMYLDDNSKIGIFSRLNYYNEEHRDLFIKLFRTAYSLFEIPQLKMSDIKAIRRYVCIKIISDYKITIEEKDFNQLINNLLKDNIVKTIMSGDDRKIAYVSMD